MTTILIYTENYEPGGGNRYVMDIINAIPASYSLILASNIGGVFQHDFQTIKRQYQYIPFKIFSIENMRLFFQKRLISVKQYQLMVVIIKIIRRVMLSRIIKLCLLIIFSQINKKRFSTFLHQHQPDLIISCNGGFPAALTCLDIVIAAKCINVPTILTVVSVPAKKSIIDLFYNDVLNVVSLLVVNANVIKNNFIDSRQVQSSKIHVLYNCISENITKGNSETFLQKYHLKSDKTIQIGYIGRLEEMKGIYDLLEAFSIVAKIVPQIKLILVGKVCNPEKINQIIQKFKLQEQIVLTGFYDGSIADALAAIDIFVFPSWWEGFPYSILEAMSAGKIIISTNVGGISEAITDQQNGILIPPKNPQALSNAMIDVLQNMPKYENFGYQAIIKINQQFHWDIFKNHVSDIIERILVK